MSTDIFEHDDACRAEEADEHALSAARADALLRGHPWKRFAVLGDSLSEGLMEELPGYRPVSWADRVRDALARSRPDLAYLNLGYRGLLAAQVRERQLGPALEFGPDLATVVCGGNDMFAPQFDRTAVEAHIEAMVGALTGAGSLVFLFGLMNVTAALPRLGSIKPRLMGLNARVALVAKRHGAVFVDLWDHPAAGDPDMYSSDLVHMSARGHALIAAATLRALAEHLPAGG